PYNCCLRPLHQVAFAGVTSWEAGIGAGRGVGGGAALSGDADGRARGVGRGSGGPGRGVSAECARVVEGGSGRRVGRGWMWGRAGRVESVGILVAIVAGSWVEGHPLKYTPTPT